MSRRKNLKDCRRVVVKLGTSTLTYSNGQLNLRRIERLVRKWLIYITGDGGLLVSPSHRWS